MAVIISMRLHWTRSDVLGMGVGRLISLLQEVDQHAH